MLETEWNPSNINDFFWNWKTVILQDIFNSITSKYNVYGLKIASNFVNMGMQKDTGAIQLILFVISIKEMFCIK